MEPSTIISELGNNNNNNVALAAFLCHISLLQLVATLIKFQYFIVIQLFGRIIYAVKENSPKQLYRNKILKFY